MKQLNYNHLYYFYVIAREGSIVKAARLLHVTPQTLSGQLATFEKYLGFELFDRHGKRLILNAQGKIAYQHADDIFSKGQHLLDTLQAREKGHINEFVVGITDVVPKVLTFDFVKKTMEQTDTTRFVFKEGDFDSLLAELAINKIDMILSDRPVTSGTAVKASSHFIGETGISFFSQNLASKLGQDFPSSLDKRPILVPSDKARMKSILSAWFESNQIKPDIVAEFDDSALLKLFGSEGFGIFCAPSIIEQEVETQYRVKCIGRTQAITERYYGVVGDNRKNHEMVKKLLSEAKALFN